MFRPRPSCTIVFTPQTAPLNMSSRTPCASLSSAVGCVLDDRCRCSVPCWRRRDVFHDSYHWRWRHVLDDRCRRSVPCWRRRHVLNDGSWCCVRCWRHARHPSPARSPATNKHVPTLVLKFLNRELQILRCRCSQNWWITLEQQEVRSCPFCFLLSSTLRSTVVFER